MKLRNYAVMVFMIMIVVLAVALAVLVANMSGNLKDSNQRIDSILSQRNLTRTGLQNAQDSQACFTRTLNDQLLALDDVVIQLQNPPPERDPAALADAFNRLTKAREDAANADKRCVEPYRIPDPEVPPPRPGG